MSEQYAQIQKRLAFIDQYLFFRGQINRINLINHFDIGVATASRTLRQYRDLYPDNLAYSISDRSYMATPSFKAAYVHDVHRTLMLIAYGLDIREVEGARFAPLAPPMFTAPLCAEVVSVITRALIAGQGVEMRYASGTSGVTQRIIFPCTLFQGGGAWYMRAFDTLRGQYRTFRLNRIRHAKIHTELSVDWQKQPDAEWQQVLTITLAPHPKRHNQEALKEDLGLIDKPVQNIQANAVTAAYILIDLRVDCSPKGDLDPYAYPLRLVNRHELVVAGMEITPGFCKD